MGFYVYENWQAGPHKAVIYNGSCGFCNDRRGRACGYDRTRAQWHPEQPPAFTRLDEARGFARDAPTGGGAA